MNVSANFLTGLRGTEDSDDRDFRPFGNLRWSDIFAQLRVITGRRGLVVIDAVEPEPEQVHTQWLDNPWATLQEHGGSVMTILSVGARSATRSSW